MHIHPNNNLQLASLGFAREETQAIQAKRAAEVRKKLSAASRVTELAEDKLAGISKRVETHSYAAEQQRQGEEDGFARLFSAKA